MTPEAQRIAIAEACGWRYGPFDTDHKYAPGKQTGGTGWIEKDGYHHDSCPGDYLTDLNAMHEAEKVLNPAQRASYFMSLGMIAGKRMMSLRHQQYWGVVTATAAQRAEAFLRCLNLWDDSK